MKRGILLCSVAVLWFLVGRSEGRAENLLTNGSFEEPALDPGRIQAFGMSFGNTNLPGWSVGTLSSLFLISMPIFRLQEAADGYQCISLNGSDLSLAQTFPTQAGETYEAAFQPGFYQGPSTMVLSASILSSGGNTLAQREVPIVPQVGWQERTQFLFVAATEQTTIVFTATNVTPNVDLLVDHVSVHRPRPQLRITGSGSSVELRWLSLSNKVYQIQHRLDLTTDPWKDLGAPLYGTGDVLHATQPVTGPQQFFRVVTLP